MAKDIYHETVRQALIKDQTNQPTNYNDRKMERLNFLKDRIRQVMEVYLAELQQPSNEHVHFETIIDEKKHHYQIVALGWEGSKRIFNLLFHLDIIDDKIWVQEDKMEQSIAEMLVESGVPKHEIVLAYFPEFHRKFTEYAVS